MVRGGFIRGITILLCVVLTSAHAEEFSYAAPEKTPLKLNNISKYGVAHFSGSITIEGEYEVTLNAWDDDKFEPYTSFYPDSNSLKYLPAPTIEGSYDTPPNAILLTNRNKAAKLLLSKTEYKKLMNIKRNLDKYTGERRVAEFQNFNSFRGFARLKIDDYATAVECDARWYSARLLSVERKTKQLAESNYENLPC